MYTSDEEENSTLREKEIVEHFDENRVLREKRKIRFPYNMNRWYNNEIHLHNLSILLEYYIIKIHESTKKTIEEKTSEIQDDVKKYRRMVEYDEYTEYYERQLSPHPFNYYDAYRKQFRNITKQEEDVVLNYAYKQCLSEKRKEIETLLTDIMHTGTCPSIITNYCV